MPEHGYAGEILKVDLSNGKITKQPSKDYTDRYIGGHGVAARLYWEMVPPEAKAYDPENCFIAASGPVAGFPGFAGSRWKLCGKTPLGDPESFSYCNLGERWGAILKFAGYDALTVQGKAEKPVYIYIHDSKIEIRNASHLWGQSTFDASDSLKAELGNGVSVLTIGPAAENLVPFSIVLAEGGASGSGGLGALMGSKNLKAIAVAGDKRPVAAHPDRVRKMVDLIQAGRPKMDMPSMWGIPGLTHPHACYGCGIGCSRELYPAEKNRQYKALCQASNMYVTQAIKYNSGKNDGAHLLGTRLCDGYGLDASVMQSMVEWLETCYHEGILDEKKTGLPLSKIGSPEFIQELTRKISFKEGFGATLARGIIAAAESVGPKAKDMLHMFVATRGSEKKDYDPRMLITTALCYATEPRRPIQQLHEVASVAMMWLGMGGNAKPGVMLSTENFRKVAEKIWGSAIAADFSTYEGKALAAKKLQDRVFAKESLVICDLRWTMTQVARALGTTPDTVTESQVYSAITGKEVDDRELWKIGERIFNLQRAILLRQGWQGRKGDRILDYFFTEPLKKAELMFNADGLMPGKNGEIISRVGAFVEKDKFEQMKTEYYGYRGWDAETGFPTKAKLEELQLKDVAADLEKRGIAK
jgi:aldehyde:ferredoxin oxidoreductase